MSHNEINQFLLECTHTIHIFTTFIVNVKPLCTASFFFPPDYHGFIRTIRPFCPSIDTHAHIHTQCRQNETIQLKMSMKIQQQQKIVHSISLLHTIIVKHHRLMVQSRFSTLELLCAAVFMLLSLCYTHKK